MDLSPVELEIDPSATHADCIYHNLAQKELGDLLDSVLGGGHSVTNGTLMAENFEIIAAFESLVAKKERRDFVHIGSVRVGPVCRMTSSSFAKVKGGVGHVQVGKGKAFGYRAIHPPVRANPVVQKRSEQSWVCETTNHGQRRLACTS